MHAPQVIYLALLALGFGLTLARGRGRDVLANLVAVAVNLGVLYWGGFFGG